MDVFFFFKQKTAYEMRISDWSSDVCSSDLHLAGGALLHHDLLMAVDARAAAVDGGDGEREELEVQRIDARVGDHVHAQLRRHGRIVLLRSQMDEAVVADRKSVGSEKSGSVRVDLVGRRITKQKKKKK